MDYPISFFEVCMEECLEDEKRFIVNTALAVRGSTSEPFEEFTDMINGIGKPKVVNHSANMALLTGELT